MTRFRLLALCVTAALVLLAYALSRSPNRTALQQLPLADMPVGSVNGTKWVQTITFSELGSVGTFTAKVESKEVGQDVSGKPHTTNRVEFLTIWLLLREGQEFAIRQESPDGNAKAFYDYLKTGAEYSFPAVWNDWNKRQNK